MYKHIHSTRADGWGFVCVYWCVLAGVRAWCTFSNEVMYIHRMMLTDTMTPIFRLRVYIYIYNHVYIYI